MKNKTVKTKKRNVGMVINFLVRSIQQQPTATSLPQGCTSALPLFALRHVGAQTLHQRRSYKQLPKQIPTVNLHSWNINANTCSLTLAAKKMSKLDSLFPEQLGNVGVAQMLDGHVPWTTSTWGTQAAWNCFPIRDTRISDQQCQS